MGNGETIMLNQARHPSCDGSRICRTAAGRPKLIRTLGWYLVASALLLTSSLFADELELKNGKQVRGKVIKETSQFIIVEVSSGVTTVKMRFPLEQVRAVTVDGKRRVLTGSSSRRVGPGSGATGPGVLQPPGPGGAKGSMRSRAEVEAIIKQSGRTPPDWWDSVALDYPRTLELTWPKPEPPWSPSKYLGQYIISVVNPNPGKWKGAAKLLHHTLTVNKGAPRKLWQTMDRLGHVYGNLLGDYARAAFWWRKAGEMGQRLTMNQAVGLARCYWQLGSKEMAKEMLQRIGPDRTGSGSVIRLWAEIGELKIALDLAAAKARSEYAHVTYLAAGDACRSHGAYGEALIWYQKVLTVPSKGKRKQGIDTYKSRARDSMQAIKVFETLDLSRIPDGTYKGVAVGFRGSLEVAVKVKQGRIQSVKVSKHREDWFYTALTSIPERIVQNQGLKGVDAVTGATVTSEAIINATAKALASGMQ